MADCSYSLAICTENKCFSTIYYVLVGYENLGIPLSDTSKSIVKKKPQGHPLIIKLLLSLWLLYKNYINYINYHYISIHFYISKLFLRHRLHSFYANYHSIARLYPIFVG